jgi:hypothetical protein
MSAPIFALVGHPNKGKSSLVATLARDATVRVGPEPGTTTHARPFPLRVGGKVLYTLVDTPGFQRARAALDWMKQHESDAGSRPAVVARFVEEHQGEERFRNECELLRPIVEGAGLIYVVDGATPYGAEYDAEMEILRWTGQPGIAVINPIGQPRFVDSWQRALEQFFRVVRVLDVLKAPFEQQIELLQTFGQMRETWRGPVEEAVAALVNHRAQQADDAARVIAEMMADALTHGETKDVAKDDEPARYAAGLEEAYRRRLRQLEQRARSEIESIYGFEEIDREEVEMDVLETDLLSQESWIAFGLKKRDLVVAGAAGGAIAGGMIDAGLLGASFLTGTIVGGAIGGALGYFSSDKLAEVKLLHQPLGGTRLRYGPTKNVQFPFVLLGRALLHHRVVEERTHAQRGVLKVGYGEKQTTLNILPEGSPREFSRHFNRLQRTEPGSSGRATALVDLTQAIGRIMRARLLERKSGA